MPESITIPGLDDDEQAALNALWAQLRSKQRRNLLRSAYYDGKNAVRHLGISLPDNCRQLAIVLGWSAKAVDVLNDRCVLDGFTSTGGSLEGTGLNELLEANMVDVEAPQVGVSSLIHATAFLIAHQGDTEAGEPPALITAKDGLSGTGEWDPRRRVLSSFLSIIDTDEQDAPVDLVLYLPNLNVSCRRDPGGAWEVSRSEHSYGMTVEPLIYRPRLARPFGSSRISRAVMSLHDSAIRTALRSEVTAELYSVPQRIILGAGEEAFTDANGDPIAKWQLIMGRLWGLPDDEDASVPRADIKEFSASTQEPHVAQLRAWAQLFAGETSINVSSLGISTEANPASAEAYYASREDLIKLAEATTDGWTPAWRRTVIRALQMWNGWDEANTPEPVLNLRPKWRNHATPSRAAAADAAAKTLDKFPWLAESPMGLELYGFDQDFIERAMAEKRRTAGAANLASITEAARANRTAVTNADTGSVPG